MPRWKEGVSAACEYCSAHLNIGRRVILRVLCAASDEILRVLADRRMVRRHMVWHEVQDQVHAPLQEFPAGKDKPFRTTEMRVDHVAPHTIGRSHVVFGTKVRESFSKISKQGFVLIGNPDARRTSLPHSH